MQFGGAWTEEKLQILERYLDAYTTALKNTPFNLVYIDAFAGAGQIDLQEDRDAAGFRRGSTLRAIQIRDKPFDELVFVEKDPARCADLERLRDDYRIAAVRVHFLCWESQWNRSRDVRHNVPFFFKQWGGVFKKRAGRMLDGRTWDRMPAVVAN